MTEQTGATNATEEIDEQGEGFEPIASQEALDKIIQARVARERKRFEDYDELKAKADRLAEFEESQKTEAQKQQEALDEAQRELAELRVAKVRAEVAAAKGVPVGLLTGGTQDELEAAADALIEFRGERDDRSLVVPGEGRQPSSKGGTAADEFAVFLDSKLS